MFLDESMRTYREPLFACADDDERDWQADNGMTEEEIAEQDDAIEAYNDA